jgi:hypothetical protein
MINRYYIACSMCGQRHTLRITLGYDKHQEHTFSCVNCGEDIRVGLELDFENRVRFRELPQFSAPKVVFQPLYNCVTTEEEGAIINLDPVFLVPDELLHQDGVFPWMFEAHRIGYINEPTLPAPIINDVIYGLGGERNVREKLDAARRAWDLAQRGRHDLCQDELRKFAASVGLEEISLNQMLLVTALLLLGQTREEEVVALRTEISDIHAFNPAELERFRSELFTPKYDELISHLVGVLKDYLMVYNQLGQALLYARRDVAVNEGVVASSKDLRRTKMFYGECFEQISDCFVVPACLNNIKAGRKYDEFETMTLKKYLSTNKVGRASPFINNEAFSVLCDEFDSVIRNASHHGGMRVKVDAPDFIEYRSGDTGRWRTMPYSEFLWRGNKIMLCAMKMLIVIIVLAEGLW